MKCRHTVLKPITHASFLFCDSVLIFFVLSPCFSCRIDEIKRDIAKIHIQLIAPYLARHGVAHERQKFAERVAKGGTSTTNVEEWLADAVNTKLGPNAGASEDKDRLIQAIVRGEGKVQKETFADAFIHLIKKLEVYRAKLPETMSWDGRRIGKLRDELDTISLVAVFAALLRQFLLLRGACPAPPAPRRRETRVRDFARYQGWGAQQLD